MQQFERIYQLHQILANRRTPIPRTDLADRLGCSRATLTRLISSNLSGSDVEVQAAYRQQDSCLLGFVRWCTDRYWARHFCTIAWKRHWTCL